MSTRLAVRARRAILPGGESPATLFVEDGVFVAILPLDSPVPAGVEILDAEGFVVLPGLVDSHVHVNEPGRTHWEGFDTATRAAAAGGVTTIVDMPLNSLPPTTTVPNLEVKRDAARGRVWVDVAFWGGAIPGNVSDLGPLDEAGVCGVKAFMVDSGVPEFPPLDRNGLREALGECHRLGMTLLVHAEDPQKLAEAPPLGPEERRYAKWLESRPSEAEGAAVGRLMEAMEWIRGIGTYPRVHVVHLSAGHVVDGLRNFRILGIDISAETCPHYLALSAEEIPDGATLFKCAPPIRERANRDRLWNGLRDGTISLIASDHSPSPPDGKALESGDFSCAWGGISSLGLGLSIVWTEAVRRGFPLSDVARWMSSAPAKLARLHATKGAIAPGMDADFILFDPDTKWTVVPDALRIRHKITPYAWRELRGQVRETWLAGQRVFEAYEAGIGTFEATPRGRLLTPGERSSRGART